MTLHDRVPVEPLTPERLERLERRVVAAAGPALARPARHALWPWGLTLAAAAAGALAVYAFRPAPPAPPPAPIAVTTDARGATLDLGEAQIVAGPVTRYDVIRGRAGGAIDLRLDHGVVHLDVAPRQGRAPLWVHAGDVGVRVVGTAFTVTRAPGDGEVTVEVAHGTVEVHRAGAIDAVTDGQRWSSDDGTVIAIAGPVKDDTANAGAGTDTLAAPLGADDRHTPDLATGPSIDVAVLGGRTTTVPGAGSGSDKVNPRGDARPIGDRGGSSKPVDVPVPPEDMVDIRARIRGQSLAPGMSVAGATAGERVGELRRLMTVSRGAAAATALYSLARAQHVELGLHAEAVKNLDAYLNRFATGAELEEVRWLRLRILCRGAFTDECRAAAHTYAERYPGTTRGDIADVVKQTP